MQRIGVVFVVVGLLMMMLPTGRYTRFPVNILTLPPISVRRLRPSVWRWRWSPQMPELHCQLKTAGPLSWTPRWWNTPSWLSVPGSSLTTSPHTLTVGQVKLWSIMGKILCWAAMLQDLVSRCMLAAPKNGKTYLLKMTSSGWLVKYSVTYSSLMTTATRRGGLESGTRPVSLPVLLWVSTGSTSMVTLPGRRGMLLGICSKLTKYENSDDFYLLWPVTRWQRNNWS